MNKEVIDKIIANSKVKVRTHGAFGESESYYAVDPVLVVTNTARVVREEMNITLEDLRRKYLDLSNEIVNLRKELEKK